MKIREVVQAVRRMPVRKKDGPAQTGPPVGYGGLGDWIERFLMSGAVTYTSQRLRGHPALVAFALRPAEPIGRHPARQGEAAGNG